jgi:hypothetical protein
MDRAPPQVLVIVCQEDVRTFKLPLSGVKSTLSEPNHFDEKSQVDQSPRVRYFSPRLAESDLSFGFDYLGEIIKCPPYRAGIG